MRSKRLFVIIFSLVATAWLSLPAQAQQELKFTAVEKNGAKVWEGAGTIAPESPVTLKVKNTLDTEHGFAIDTMNIKRVLKPGEEMLIVVPADNIDSKVSEHRVYCQLHPKHVPAVIKVTGK